jgi:hypothetical protein
MKDGFRLKAYERWDDPDGHFIQFKNFYRDDPFYTDSTKVEAINNFLFQKEQFYDLKMKLSILESSVTRQSLQESNKPSDFSQIFQEFYKEHKMTLETIKKEQTKIFDYKKMNKFVQQYYLLLKEKVEEVNIHESLLEMNIESMTTVAHQLVTLLELPKEDLTEIEKKRIKQNKDYVGFAIKRTKIDDQFTYSVNDETIKKEANKHTTSAIERFINKNTQKVSKILENRKDLDKIVVNVSFQKKTVQGKIQFSFTNGDRFDVFNQLVKVEYETGKISYRMPTTFHNVSKDNRFQKKTSQEWMIENF